MLMGMPIRDAQVQDSHHLATFMGTCMTARDAKHEPRKRAAVPTRLSLCLAGSGAACITLHKASLTVAKQGLYGMHASATERAP